MEVSYKNSACDFAGGTVIHIAAAFSGLTAILYLGKRQEHNKNNQALSNMGLVGIGVHF